jgi:hypothetical protein
MDDNKNNNFINQINKYSTIILSITIPFGIYIGFRLLILEFGNTKKEKSILMKYFIKSMIEGIKEENNKLFRQFTDKIFDTIKNKND